MSHSWRKTLIDETSTIKQALEVINSEAMRVAVVVDSYNKLLGVVTDGDIRRGLLDDKTLSDSVSAVMNATPLTAEQTASNEHLLELMKQKQILTVPLLDEERRVVGLKTLHSTLTTDKYKNPVFIMAGGFGTRLRPLTDNCPKPMLKVGDKPILETVIRSFIRAGFENFYISTHYMPERIKQYFGDGSNLGVDIRYVHEEVPLGTGGALGLLPDGVPSDTSLIVINGDVLTNVDFRRLLEFHNENNADATMCVREYEYQVPYGVIKGSGNRVTSMIEKPVERFFVNAGIYVLSPQVVNSVERNKALDMPTLLEQHMKDGQQVLMFPIHEYWLDIGRMDDFKKAQADILTLGIAI